MAFAGKKVLQLAITLLLVSILTFLALQVIPGDPARAKLGITASEAEVAALRTRWGLDRPPVERYLDWIRGMATGNPGESIQYSRPVATLIGERMPVTLTLAALGLLMTLGLGIPLGLIAVRRPGGALDRVVQAVTQVSLAVPPFFMGILLQLLFGFVLKWMRIGGYQDYRSGFLPFAASLLVPALALALPRSAMVASFLRGSLLGQLRTDYVRTAKSKGASDARVLYRHVFQNAIIPVLSTLGVITAELLGGSLIVEQVFNLPGLGRLLIMAIGSRDFPLIQTMVVYIAAMVVLVNLLTDLLYRVADPRIRV